MINTQEDTASANCTKAACIVLNKQAKTPLYQQIYEFFRKGIEAGDLKPGDKLPSIRALSADLGVARNTIDSAYKQLSVEGYVRSRQGSGYLVQETSRNMLAGLPTPDVCRHAGNSVSLEPPKCRYDFSYGDLIEGTFPMDIWRRLASDVLSDGSARSLVAYGDWRGNQNLRVQIARHLKRMRNINCSPDQVVVTSGTQQSIALVLGLFDAASDRVACDDPGYFGAHAVISDLGFRIDRLRTDCSDDAFLADVEKSRARIFYTTPSHQFPMGWCMNQDVRSQLLRTAVDRDAFILEDDYDSGYRYTAQPVPSLCSLDNWGRVIYLGTFSKVLSPALRLSYLVLPPTLLSRYEQRYRSMRPTASWVDQEILARFMEEGHWERHLRRTILGYRKRYKLLMQTLKKCFDGRVTVHEGEAGLFVLLEVDNGMDQNELVESAQEMSVRVAGTKRYWLDDANAPDNLVMLGFSAASSDQIRRGIPLLKKAWFRECGQTR